MEKTAMDYLAEKSLRNGVISKEQYDGLHRDIYGCISDSYPVGENAYRNMFLGWDLDNKGLLDFVLEDFVPPLGAEHMFPIFRKYGCTIAGMCDGWHWDERSVRNAPESDLWQMIALATLYDRGRDRNYNRRDA